jgi:hypothetical protein
MDPQEEQLKNGLSIKAKEFGRESPASFGLLVTDNGQQRVARRIPSESGAYPEFYRCLAAALRGSGTLPIDPTDAAKVIRVIELARKSAVDRCWIEWQRIGPG